MKVQVALLLALGPVMAFAADKDHVAKIINESANVFNEIMSAPDKGIPRDILHHAQCIGIIPNMKRAGFIVGAKYGKGVLTCRVNGGGSGGETPPGEAGNLVDEF